MINEARFFSGTSYLRNLQGTAPESQESPFQGDSCTLERGAFDLEQEVQKLASYKFQNYVQLPLISPSDDAKEIQSGCGGGNSGCGGGSITPAPPSPPPTHSDCCCSGSSCCCCTSHTEKPKPPAPAPKPPKPPVSSGC
ncbi:MAG: hypothetical protein HYU64_03025 [Armatimonadetes bacterium]|nr:hypothetical protein [Armatimonadota bacterium]